MKRVLISAATIMLAISCSLSDIDADLTNGVNAPDITATLANESSQTKTSISVNGEGIGKIWWKPADQINIFYGTTSTKYTSTNTEEATTVVFKTTDIIGSTESASSNRWGLYPYNEAAICDGNAVTTMLPSSQAAVEETFADNLFPMLAHSEDNMMTFYNVCGGIKFSLSRDDIKRITFKGNNNEDLAGKVKFTLDSKGKPIAEVIAGEKTITLAPIEDSAFAKSTNYYIVMLPTVLSGGFTMIFETASQLGTFTYDTEAVEIKRSVFSRKADIDTYASFVDKTENCKITYSSPSKISPNTTSGFGATYLSDESTYNTDSKTGVLMFDSAVTAIPAEAFSYSPMTAVSIPTSVTTIGDNAFFETDLYSIIIPDGVLSIGDYAFEVSHESWREVEESDILILPQTLEYLGYRAFVGNTFANEIVIPKSVSTLGSGALGFFGFEHTNRITVDSENPYFDSRNGFNGIIETATDKIIIGMDGEEAMVIPEGVKTIGNCAFAFCSHYTSLSIPSSVTRIEISAFNACQNLTGTLTIPKSVTYIGSAAFFYCIGLTSIKVPRGATVENDAFSSCVTPTYY